jgi:hypothetical protein
MGGYKPRILAHFGRYSTTAGTGMGDSCVGECFLYARATEVCTVSRYRSVPPISRSVPPKYRSAILPLSPAFPAMVK